MITCKLYGRTGNQLFQIAATIGHAVRNGFEYRIPKQTENPELWPKIKTNTPELDGSEKFAGFYHEHTHKYLSLPPSDNIILDGYFQSYKYFEHIIPSLRQIFNSPNLTRWNTIAIHVRRGDYLNFPDKHPVLPLRYYMNSIQHIVQQMGWIDGEFEIKVFSDDYEWCEENFKPYNIGYKCIIKERIHPDEPAEYDLFEMATSQHIIIANSSFSYWAAILNANPNKIICSPRYDSWFGPGNKHLDTIDLLPPTWKQIDY